MSKFTEVLTYRDKQAIASLEGTVTKVSAPRAEADLSEGQKKAGVHPQDITLTDDDGVSIECQIIKSNLHVPATIRGRRVRIESGANDDGSPAGLRASVYQGKCKAVVAGGASITNIGGGNTAKPEPAKQASEPSKGEPAQGKFVLPSANDHVEALLSLFDKFCNGLSDHQILGEQHFEIAYKMATSVYIQVCKEGGLGDLVANQSPKTEGEKAIPTIEKFASLVWDLKVSPETPDGKRLDDTVSMGLFSYKDLYSIVRDKLESIHRPGLDQQVNRVQAMLLKRGEPADDAYRIVMMDFKTIKAEVTDYPPF